MFDQDEVARCLVLGQYETRRNPMTCALAGRTILAGTRQDLGSVIRQSKKQEAHHLRGWYQQIMRTAFKTPSLLSSRY